MSGESRCDVRARMDEPAAITERLQTEWRNCPALWRWIKQKTLGTPSRIGWIRRQFGKRISDDAGATGARWMCAFVSAPGAKASFLRELRLAGESVC